MSKIVLIAYKSDTEDEHRALAHVQSVLAHLDSAAIRDRFEIFDIVDSSVSV